MKRRNLLNPTKRINRLSVGEVLLAKPLWQEEEYKRSVILLLEHDHNGSAGLIINKQSNLTVYDALPDLNIKDQLLFGGPTEIKTVSYIHKYASVPDSIKIGPGLFWGGDYDEVVRMFGSRRIHAEGVRFCAGFVHWVPGQLDDELENDRWWVDDITPNEIFTSTPEEIWGYKLMATGHDYGIFNHIPDPSYN
jgi:putative transcriptional regulator